MQILQKDVIAIDDSVQEYSRELQKRSSEIVRYRRLQKNANTAIDHISMCLPVLENCGKLHELMNQKKYSISILFFVFFCV